MSDVRWKLEVGFYPLSFILNYKNFPKDLSISRVLSIRQSADCVTIHLGAAFRRHSRNLPAPISGTDHTIGDYSVLHRVGFTSISGYPENLVVSYTTLSPLPVSTKRRTIGGLLSAALSISAKWRTLPVREHPVLRCPDFPHQLAPTRSPNTPLGNCKKAMRSCRRTLCANK